MADAKHVEAVTKTEIVEVEPAKVSLDLDIREAAVLLRVLGRFYRGGETAPIYNALATAVPPGSRLRNHTVIDRNTNKRTGTLDIVSNDDVTSDW